MFNSIFKIIYFVELVLIIVIRKYYLSKYKKLTFERETKSVPDLILLGINGLAMLIPIVYVFTDVLDFADYTLPDWTGYLGAVLFALAIGLLWKTHIDLGRNWTPTVGVRHEHTLIIHGVFKYLRHPMYAAHLYWAVAQVLMLHNWIAGYCFLVAQVPFYLIRIRNEEAMLKKEFGDSYIAYMKSTKRFIPYLF